MLCSIVMTLKARNTERGDVTNFIEYVTGIVTTRLPSCEESYLGYFVDLKQLETGLQSILQNILPSVNNILELKISRDLSAA